MNRNKTDAGARRKGATRGGLWGPVLANLGIGVPATVPLYLAWWLLTKYVPMDCKTSRDVVKPGLVNCNYTILDRADLAMILLAVTGVLIFALVVAIDVMLPLRRGRRPAVWLGAAVLIPVPFAVCMALA